MSLAVLLAPVIAGAAPAEQPPPPPANQELIYRGEATSILGRSVHDPEGHQVGRIVDVLVDDQGQPRAAVIDFGGFMGVDNRRIAVAWRALHFLPDAEQHRIRIDMTVDQIKATPDYKPAARPLDPPMTMAAPPPPPGMPTLGK
jgi:sporulation protein YlmC with PRC-barrel domain